MGAASSRALGSLAAGRWLGRYELLLPVAAGGMAAVWAARLRGTRGFAKTVALKVMFPALSADARFCEMFLAEARLASLVEHANVCNVLDLGEEDGLLYLAMEWVDGESLAALMSGTDRLPFPVAARIALDTARGLHAAHEAKDESGASLGLVHRDVSPQNVLVAVDGTVKIADFGVAKATGLAEPRTKSGYVKGKVRYLAPEQVYCEDVDRRTDVFALGVVLYEATTGKHPFPAPTDVGRLARIASPDPARPPMEIDEAYPTGLATVVMRALEKDPDARYPSMAELADDLALRGGPCEVQGVASFVERVAGERLASRRAALAQSAIDASRARADATSRESAVTDGEREGGATPAAGSPRVAAAPQRSWFPLVAAMGVGGAIAIAARAPWTHAAASSSAIAPTASTGATTTAIVITSSSSDVPAPPPLPARTTVPSAASADVKPLPPKTTPRQLHSAPAALLATPAPSSSTGPHDLLESRE